MKYINRTCQVCGGSSADRIYANAMSPLGGLDMSYILARCNNCGFHFASELPNEKQYLLYYNVLSKYDTQLSVSPLDKERIDATVNLCLSQGLHKESRIIDLGCGFGALLAALRDVGYTNLQGVDPAPQSSRQAQELFGINHVYQGTLSTASAVVNLYEADLVCLMAVLEHLPELQRDMKKLFSQLRPGTQVLVEVPALDLFESEDGEPFGELSIEHIQFFSAQSMRNLFSNLGATILEQKLLPLSGLHSGALFMLAELTDDLARSIAPEQSDAMDKYLAGSENRWKAALKRVPSQPFVLYGAGSHSARLLQKLDQEQCENLVAILDGNINLHGKRFGKWVVESPDSLTKYPSLPVLISSYRSELTIARDLKQRFPNQPLRLMYDNV
jgi:2-polyprenyl-3-methyl-5-hydroxy-6-metoxy-1,4-benzoquinol methylase